MRIVDEWNHNEMKVTAFHMNGRYSIKLERNILEQWYKFRDGQFERLDELKAMLDEAFYEKVEEIFIEMLANRARLFESMESSHDFDEII